MAEGHKKGLCKRNRFQSCTNTLQSGRKAHKTDERGKKKRKKEAQNAFFDGSGSTTSQTFRIKS